ncbi:MAG TPA: Rpn family recombination-promoting nuclease/putative transposase [Leptospiraceae bacterium]|nr:Rpn family recombination-promoting nuclease/putative transposase [Leptospiraceae bacterium]HRG75685.1 Rpn family recombination-promoting nuclease/putative transposase [Leptospiraceae bacterium]
MKLLPLTNDFTFKAVFSKEDDVLIDLLNSFPDFQGKNQITAIKILNPEMPRDMKTYKAIVLDIKAIDQSGNKFLIEMQASRQPFFTQRVLYYWSKLYSKSITKGQDYKNLTKVYSFNFVNFEIFPKQDRFYWSFQISDKNQNEIILTEDLNIYIIEMPKFLKDLDSLQSPLDFWIYLLKEVTHLKGEQMKTLKKKNPKIKKALDELKFVSQDKRSRELYEARLKTEMDYSARFEYQLQKMKEEGKLEGLQEGIRKTKVETAKQLLAWGMKRDQIRKITGLKDSDF